MKTNNNLLKIIGLSTAVALGPGCANINPKDVGGQYNQYSAAARKVQEYKFVPVKVVEDSSQGVKQPVITDFDVHGFKLSKVLDAYANNCLDLSTNEKISISGGDTQKEKAENFGKVLGNYNSSRLENNMLCLAGKEVDQEAKEWRDLSYITEPASFAIWVGNYYKNVCCSKSNQVYFQQGSSSRLTGNALQGNITVPETPAVSTPLYDALNALVPK